MSKSLLDYFEAIPDPRKASGLRHHLGPFLAMATMAMMSGYKGFRELGSFMEANEEYFTKVFGLKHGVPKFVQIRTIFSRLDFDEVNKAFNQWAMQFMPQGSGNWVSGDGKGLSSTVTDMHGPTQDFVLIVSLFCHRTGIVLKTQRRHNGKGGEIPALNELLAQLQTKGMIITLDALHCKKNGSPDH